MSSSGPAEKGKVKPKSEFRAKIPTSPKSPHDIRGICPSSTDPEAEISFTTCNNALSISCHAEVVEVHARKTHD